MNMISPVEVFLALFIGMGPIKVLLVYISMTENMEKDVRRAVARRTVTVAAAVGLGLFILGAFLQAILHFPGRCKRHVLVGGYCLFEAGILDTHIVLDSAVVEYVPLEKGSQESGRCTGVELVRETASGHADRSGDYKTGIEVCLADADGRTLGGRHHFGRPHIRPPPEQIGRYTDCRGIRGSGDFPGRAQQVLKVAGWHPQQKTQGVLSPIQAELQRGNQCLCIE